MYQNRLSQEAAGLSGRNPFVQPSLRPKTSQSFDSMLLMVLACFGIIGFSYVFYCFVNPEMGPNPNDFSFVQSAVPLGLLDKDTTQSDLEISGSYEPNEPISFTLSSYNPNISYILEFGDGEEFILTDKHCKYTYKNQGSYQLKMKALFNQKAKLLYSKTLNIQHSDLKDGNEGENHSSI